MSKSPRPYLILCCARSGSTSLARILGTAENGCCAIEPAPNLNRETRLMMDGRLGDPAPVLEQTVAARVREQMQKCEIYGEKNLTYGPFIEPLHRLVDCRFIYLKRDGRDVVRSLIDWHDQMFGSIYRECADAGRLNGRAREAAARLPVHLDTSDYSRPRPAADHPLHGRWSELSRAQMCAFYWATVNDLFMDGLARVPQSDSFTIDYTGITADRILEAASFLGLTGLRRDGVQAMLDQRVNSLTQRANLADRCPAWPDWDSGERDRFCEIAGDAMRRAGYISAEADAWRPGGFDVQAFDHAVCPEASAALPAVARWIRDAVGRARSVAVLGAPPQTAPDGWHGGLVRAGAVAEGCEVVVDAGLATRTYDIDQWLRRLAAAAERRLVVLCGDTPAEDACDEHVYRYDPNAGVFRNRVSPRRCERTLRMLGCDAIEVVRGSHGFFITASVPE